MGTRNSCMSLQSTTSYNLHRSALYLLNNHREAEGCCVATDMRNLWLSHAPKSPSRRRTQRVKTVYYGPVCASMRFQILFLMSCLVICTKRQPLHTRTPLVPLLLYHRKL